MKTAYGDLPDFQKQIMQQQTGSTIFPYREQAPVELTPAAKEIMDAIDLTKIKQLLSARLLIATYIRPRKSKGGIILTDKELQEDVYQGAVGLVLMKGPLAFKDGNGSTFNGQDVQVGEWVEFRPGDSKRVQLNGINCRIVEDTQIDFVTTDPDFVTCRPTDARIK